jgi:cytoskeletal protein RodZ
VNHVGHMKVVQVDNQNVSQNVKMVQHLNSLMPNQDQLNHLIMLKLFNKKYKQMDQLKLLLMFIVILWIINLVFTLNKVQIY